MSHVSLSALARKLSPFCAALVTAGAFAGCLMDLDDQAVTDDTELGTASENLGASFFQRTWTQGEAEHANIVPLNDYFCALTGVAGKFEGAGEEVYINGDFTGSIPMWAMHGKSQQTGVSGTATCYTRGSFTGAGSQQTIVSPEFVHQDKSPGCHWYGCPVHSPSPTSITAWQGDSVTMITGMGGDFNGTEEYIEVKQASTGAASTLIEAQNDIEWNEISRIHAHSFFIGVPGAGRLARTTGIYAAGGVNGADRREMLPVDQGMCYLTRISGDFQGAHTAVTIERNNNNRWELVVKGSSGDKVYGQARCMYLNQN